MKIYPAIDMIGGEVVRLTKGDFGQKTVYGKDPIETALKFQSLGAKFLHLVDLDGAKSGAPVQTKIIKAIASRSQLKIQVGGGVRSLDHVEELLKAGIHRVVIGSLAVKDHQTTKKILETFGGQRITLGLDVMLDDNGKAMVATHGWQELSDINAKDLLDDYSSFGLDQVLCTDINRDGMMTGPNFQLYKELSASFPKIDFLASGGVTTLDQVQTLKADKVAGAIIGKAIYESSIGLEEVLKC